MRKICYGKIVVCILLPVIVLVCCISFYKNSEAESRGNKVDDVVAYESVLVCEGDTLWSIAEANLSNPTDAEIRDYVKEIAAINKISETSIHTGNYIIVPKYAVL